MLAGYITGTVIPVDSGLRRCQFWFASGQRANGGSVVPTVL
jgi:hypothetical protein